jgi:tetratricopeptide (TPR) repeat protein
VHFQSALDFVKEEQTGLTLQALADSYRAQSQWPEAIQAYLRACAQLNRAANPVELAAAERALGEVYLITGQASEALPHLESSLEIERALPQQNGGRIVSTLHSLSQAHEMRDELELAVRRQHEALVYQNARHAPEGYVQTLRTLGRLYAQMGRHSEAIKAYEEALATENRQPEPDPEKIDAMTGALADVYRAQGRLEMAASLYRRVLDKTTPGDAPLREHLADAHQATEAEIARHLETLHAAEQSWALLNRVAQPDLKGLAFVRALQAQTCAALGRWDESAQYLDQLLQLLKRRRNEVRPDDPRSIMRAFAVLLQGQDSEDAGRIDSALNAYSHALEMAEHDAKSDPELAWAIRQKVERARRKPTG